MKKGIHPEYKKSIVKCSCGNTFETRSVMEEINVEICSECHPFFTGTQKLVDTAGRVDRFKAKMEKAAALKKANSEKGTKANPPKADQPKSGKARPANQLKADQPKTNKTEPNKTKEAPMSAKGGSGVPTTSVGKGK